MCEEFCSKLFWGAGKHRLAKAGEHVWWQMRDCCWISYDWRATRCISNDTFKAKHLQQRLVQRAVFRWPAHHEARSPRLGSRETE